MSRFEGEFQVADQAAIDPIELLAALNGGAPKDEGRRQAIACFLSGGNGWKDAGARLAGAFAESVEPVAGLMGSKGK